MFVGLTGIGSGPSGGTDPKLGMKDPWGYGGDMVRLNFGYSPNFMYRATKLSKESLFWVSCWS